MIRVKPLFCCIIFLLKYMLKYMLNTSDCPPRMWRPLWDPPFCGPPCLLHPSLCPLGLDGCVPLCEIPANAYFVDASTCAWACHTGWFPNATACRPCESASCAVGELYDAYTCFASGTSADKVCTPCPPAHTLATLPGICPYSCDTNYFPTTVATVCTLCPALRLPSYYCPPGFSAQCAAAPCSPCAPSLLPQGALFVPTNDSTCRVRCKPGYHTILAGQVVPFALDQAFDPLEVQCDECGLRTLPCPLWLCPPTETLVAVVQDDIFRCIPCPPPAACPVAMYAPCDFPQHCVWCPPLTDDRFYIPSPDCATACPPDTIWDNNACVLCNTLFKVPPEALPYYNSFFARWDALPDSRWWPPIADPRHLGLRISPTEKRAGLCWPCPLGTPLHGSGPLCSNPIGQNSQVQVQIPNNHLLIVPHRRLLSTVACPPGSYVNQSVCALCPPHHFCIDQTAKRCPLFSYANSPGATQCQCLPSFVSQSNGQCVWPQHSLPAAAQAFTCPSDLVRTMMPTGAPACLECPHGTAANDQNVCVLLPEPPQNCSTWLPFEKRCACGPGSHPTNTTCEACPRGTFSGHIGDAPCTPCPLNTSTYATAATHIAQCLALYFAP